jgi:hypothetical protein
MGDHKTAEQQEEIHREILMAVDDGALIAAQREKAQVERDDAERREALSPSSSR